MAISAHSLIVMILVFFDEFHGFTDPGYYE